MASGKETPAITFYVGILNIVLALLWGALYGFGILETKDVNSPNSTIFYVGTLFAAGFGVIFPFFEKTMPNKVKINEGLAMSVVAILMYGGYIGAFLYYGTLLLPFMK
ncbi:MAG: hypothetical protein HS108_12160 [Planctomycetes bacterium]|nr:hypothetical protein [Planctomycetota bacterium]MCL4730440.1 hypothetical protein [Planctomycetota bacterium]